MPGFGSFGGWGPQRANPHGTYGVGAGAAMPSGGAVNQPFNPMAAGAPLRPGQMRGGQQQPDPMQAFMQMFQGGQNAQQQALQRQQASQQRTVGGPSGMGFGSSIQGGFSPDVNAGSRTLGSVAWDNVAGIQNFMANQARQPAHVQQAGNAWLRANGVMGSTNGMDWGDIQAQNQALNSQGGNFPGSQNFVRGSGFSGLTRGNGIGSAWDAHMANAAAFDPVNIQARAGQAAAGGSLIAQNYAGNMGALRGGAVSGPTMGGGGFPGMGGGMGMPGGFGAPGGYGAGGPTQFGLDQPIENRLRGLIANPNVFSAQQENVARNRALEGNNSGLTMALEEARNDAARRGLSPQEAEANLSAIRRRYDQQGARGVQDFDLGLAQANRGSLMNAIGAGTQYLGGQRQAESEYLRYLGILGASQAGQAPMFLS